MSVSAARLGLAGALLERSDSQRECLCATSWLFEICSFIPLTVSRSNGTEEEEPCCSIEDLQDVFEGYVRG